MKIPEELHNLETSSILLPKKNLSLASFLFFSLKKSLSEPIEVKVMKRELSFVLWLFEILLSGLIVLPNILLNQSK